MTSQPKRGRKPLYTLAQPRRPTKLTCRLNVTEDRKRCQGCRWKKGCKGPDSLEKWEELKKKIQLGHWKSVDDWYIHNVETGKVEPDQKKSSERCIKTTVDRNTMENKSNNKLPNFQEKESGEPAPFCLESPREMPNVIITVYSDPEETEDEKDVEEDDQK